MVRTWRKETGAQPSKSNQQPLDNQAEEIIRKFVLNALIAHENNAVSNVLRSLTTAPP